MLILSRRQALAMMLAAPTALRAQTPSPFVQGMHFRARLIAAGPDGPARLSGIEIMLDRGFKTYWRSPGEAGLPPRFDWSASTNAAAVEVLWPAPRRAQDAGGVAYVYEDRVILPVRVKPVDPARPVDLRLGLDFGICKQICIPARVDLSVELPAVRTPLEASEAELVKALGLSRVPAPSSIGAPGALAIAAVADAPQGGKPAFRVSVRGPADATLFAEGPEDWYVSTTPPDGSGAFTVVIEDRPREAKGPAAVRLTLVSTAGAVEADLHLDEALRPR
jgi:DsbC/DsbD-like thiol-disulfide interchange protein